MAQARAGAAEVQRALSSLVGDAAIRGQLEAAGTSISGVEQSLAGALASAHFPLAGSDLAQLGSVISAPAVTALVAEATAKASVTAAQVQALADASAATRATVQRMGDDLFTRHIFDSYLHFDSEADGPEY